MTVNTASIPTDANGKPVLALMNDATGQILPMHIGSVVTGADGQLYAKPDLSTTVANPMITQDQVRAAVLAGQIYTATTGTQANAGAGNFPCSFFVPTANTKNILLLSAIIGVANTGNVEIAQITADPAYGTNPTMLNTSIGGPASSLPSTAIGFTLTGMAAPSSATKLKTLRNGAQGNNEMLATGPIYLPKGAAGSGVGVTAWAEPGAASSWSVTWLWMEF